MTGCPDVAEHIMQARAALLAAGSVDWTGPAAAAFQEDLAEVLAALVVLGSVARQTDAVVRRHEAAVAAAPVGSPW